MKTDAEHLPGPTPDWALLLDIDGTLLDFAATPQSVIVPPDLPGTLQTLSVALQGALALVSGRSIDSIDRLFAPLILPASGQHGAEIRLRPPAPPTPRSAPPAMAQLVQRLRSFAAERPGILVEAKGAAVAVHYRLAPDRRDDIRSFLAGSAETASPEFEVLAGHCVFEVKLRGFSKGTAVREIMRDVPFAGRTPVFIGDDATDEDGFAAVNELGGHPIRVGPSGGTQARHRIADPACVRAWLARMAGALAER